MWSGGVINIMGDGTGESGNWRAQVAAGCGSTRVMGADASGSERALAHTLA